MKRHVVEKESKERWGLCDWSLGTFGEEAGTGERSRSQILKGLPSVSFLTYSVDNDRQLKLCVSVLLVKFSRIDYS